jgi:hypothetical protein
MDHKLPPTAAAHEQLDSLLDEPRQQWNCQLLFNTSPPGASCTEIDLCEELVHSAKKDYMFPDHFVGVDARLPLTVQLKIAALKSGFKLNIYSSKLKYDPNGDHDVVKPRAIRQMLCCSRYRVFQERSNKTTANRTTTKRAIKGDDCCSFIFTIYMNHSKMGETSHRWFLAQAFKNVGIKCKCHSGHFPLSSSEVQASYDLMTDEEKILANQCNLLNFSASASSTL